MSNSVVQIVATSSQLCGALVGGYGAFHAWNRVTGQLDRLQNGIVQLRNTVVSDLEAAVREYTPIENNFEVAQVAAGLAGGGQVEAAIGVRMPGTPEERLQRVENQVAMLLVKSPMTSTLRGATLEEHKAEEKVFGVKYKSVALAGLIIGLLGTVLRLLDQLSVSRSE